MTALNRNSCAAPFPAGAGSCSPSPFTLPSGPALPPVSRAALGSLMSPTPVEASCEAPEEKASSLPRFAVFCRESAAANGHSRRKASSAELGKRLAGSLIGSGQLELSLSRATPDRSDSGGGSRAKQLGSAMDALGLGPREAGFILDEVYLPGGARLRLSARLYQREVDGYRSGGMAARYELSACLAGMERRAEVSSHSARVALAGGEGAAMRLLRDDPKAAYALLARAPEELSKKTDGAKERCALSSGVKRGSRAMVYDLSEHRRALLSARASVCEGVTEAFYFEHEIEPPEWAAGTG